MKNHAVYEAPAVDMTEIAVEKGFALSGTEGGGNSFDDFQQGGEF